MDGEDVLQRLEGECNSSREYVGSEVDGPFQYKKTYDRVVGSDSITGVHELELPDGDQVEIDVRKIGTAKYQVLSEVRLDQIGPDSNSFNTGRFNI